MPQDMDSGIDWAKIVMRFVHLDTEDSHDGRVDSCVSSKVLFKINRNCGGNTFNNRTRFTKNFLGTRFLRMILGRVAVEEAEDGSSWG